MPVEWEVCWTGAFLGCSHSQDPKAQPMENWILDRAKNSVEGKRK